MNREDKQSHSLVNPYQQWHTSKKQKDLEKVNNASFSHSSVYEVDSSQVNQSNQNNNQSKNGKRIGKKNQQKYEHVRKYPTQQVSQHGDQQASKKVNLPQSRQTDLIASQKANQQEMKKSDQYDYNQSDQNVPNKWNQSFSKKADQQVSKQTNQHLQQKAQLVPKNEEFQKINDQKVERNEKAYSKTERESEYKRQDFQNEWKSDPKKYLTQNFYQNEDKYYNETQNKYNGKKGQIQTVLMVAEKPSIARKIASALSDRESERREGLVKFLPVHEYEGKFKGQKTIFKVTSVAGHIYDVDFPKKYKDWNQINPVNLFSTKTQRVEADPKHKIVKHLEKEAKNCSYLLLWLDNDKEGENICFEVKSICEKVMCFEGPNVQQVLRSKFSSLTKIDLNKAYRNISGLPNMNQSKAVDARRIIDLKIGVAFTRYQTLFLRNKYPTLNKRIISFGPCQSPTLGFCVEREDEIKNFIPSLLYKVKLTFMDNNKTQVIAYCDQQNIYTKNEVQKIKENIKIEKYINVISVSSEKLIKKRPVGLNTVEMLKFGSSQLNMSPQKTSDVADQLYLRGFITYPRTESTSYSENFDFKKVLKSLSQDRIYGEFAKNLISQGFNIPTQGVDKGDHPPITPTPNYPKPENIDESEKKLYDFISNNYIASLSNDYEYKDIQITCQVKEYSFITKGIQVINQGFTKVMKEAFQENTISSNVNQGNKLQIKSVDVEEEYTTPPHYLSESELISLMEKNSIGTDASITTHIQNICDRQYVEVDEKNRTLKPTQLGRSLIDGYKKIDSELVQPKIRAQIENSVDEIAQGKKEFSEVINESLSLIQQKYLKFVQNIQEMDNLVGLFCKTFEELLKVAQPLSKCGVCKKFMKLIEEAEKLVCQQCDIRLSLPVNGKFQIIGEKTCPKDNYQMLSFSSLNSTNDSFEFCPNCYSDSYYNKGTKKKL